MSVRARWTFHTEGEKRCGRRPLDNPFVCRSYECILCRCLCVQFVENLYHNMQRFRFHMVCFIIYRSALLQIPCALARPFP